LFPDRQGAREQKVTANAPGGCDLSEQEQFIIMRYRECRNFRSRLAFLSIFLCVGVFVTACGHSAESFVARGEEYLPKENFMMH